MADIKISDGFSLNADLKIRDDSPLAKAGLTQIVTTTKQLFSNFDKPLDQADERSVALGSTFTSPNLLSGQLPNLTAGASINCELTVLKSADKLLFADDGFSPKIPIAPNQAWLGIEFDFSATATIGAAADGLGISFTGTGKFTCASYSLFFSTPSSTLPSLRDACVAGLDNYSLVTNAAALRNQSPNTVNVCELTGSVTVAVSIEQPFTLNPLASANLPFNETASIQPTVTLQLAPSLQISGDLLVRLWKVSTTVVRLGVYKKQGSTLSVDFTAGAAIGGDIGNDDVLSALLNAALPGIDVAAAGISGDNAKALNTVLKNALNRSLSARVNATCSAAFTDEAAVLYELELNVGDNAATDRAIGLALYGDWTALEKLPNAHRLRNIAVNTVDNKTSITVNLFGFYSATSVSDYLRSCTVLVDDSGQIAIIDKVEASRISGSMAPYAADANKLRRALMEDFLCTATYAVVANKINFNLSVRQSYFDYRRSMSSAEMQDNVQLGYALELIPRGALDRVLKADSSFQHACVNAVVRYDMPSLLKAFYKDPVSRAQRTRKELEDDGRQVMCAFLDPADDTDAARIDILRNDAAWQQMDEIGNPAAFTSIPYLSHLGATELAAITADWVSVIWWAEALVRIAPALDATVTALQRAAPADPLHDASFMKARRNLANVLGGVTRNTNAAFVHGWGEAVMFALSGKSGVGGMDITWNSKSFHFGAGSST